MALMWEVRAADGRLDELLSVVDDLAHPSAQVYRADGPQARVVVIDPTGRGLDVPADLLARPPHAWHFDPVVRGHRDTP